MTLLPEQIADNVKRLRELDAKRTQGEWHNRTTYIDGSEEESRSITLGSGIIYDEGGHTIDDARYIASMPDAMQTINALVDLVGEMRGHLVGLCAVNKAAGYEEINKDARGSLAKSLVIAALKEQP